MKESYHYVHKDAILRKATAKYMYTCCICVNWSAALQAYPTFQGRLRAPNRFSKALLALVILESHVEISTTCVSMGFDL
jgi:hypothetical protein